MDELVNLLENGNITDCLSQTWCYYNKYQPNYRSLTTDQTELLENRWDWAGLSDASRYHYIVFARASLNNVFSYFRPSESLTKRSVDDCDQDKCQVVTLGHNAYKLFNAMSQMTKMLKSWCHDTHIMQLTNALIVF